MKHSIKIQPTAILLGVIVWWCTFILLSTNEWNPLGLLYVIGIPFIFFLPGFLTTVIVKIKEIDIWGILVLSLGLSILEVMVVTLLGNWLLPVFGVERPLDALPLIWEISTLALVLFAFSWGDIKPIKVRIPTYILTSDRTNLFFALPPLAFVALSIFGAIRLNNGGNEAITMFMLFAMGVFSFLVFYFSEKLQKHMIPAMLYFMGLALLFMTSLRGWFISGHDIQREFFVFQLAKESGIWNPTTYIDAYNACLSITILPTIIANVLHVPDAYVYKVVFQILFASVLIIVFLISRTWLNKQLGFLSGLFFMSFPTFFQDMPFLVRQEIAFIFYGLLLYVIFEKRLNLKLRRALFIVFGIGVVLSHYSTTYTILFVLLTTSIGVPILYFFVEKFLPPRIQSKSAVDFLAPGVIKEKKKITLTMVMALLLASVIWTSFITDTDRHAREVTKDIWTAITEGFDESARSQDVYVFFTLGGKKHDISLKQYTDEVVYDTRIHDAEAYYATSTYTDFPYTQETERKRAATAVGSFLTLGDKTFGEIISLIGSLIGKIIQLSIPIGLIYVVFRFAWVRRIDSEYYVLAASSVAFVTLCIAVPLLSREYGVFRAIQQSMLVIAPFMVVGALITGRLLLYGIEKWYAFLKIHHTEYKTMHIYRVAAFLGVVFFMYATSFVGQLVGSNIPRIHLNNYGDDYSHFIVTEEEHRAIYWLKERVKEDMEGSDKAPPLIQSDRFGKKKLQSAIATPVSGDIYPGTIRKDAYVFLGTHTVQERVAFLGYEGVLIKYEYPIEFLMEHKELVYEDYGVRIYK